ncbi:hypothetical protein PVK06_040487 [Gossypium arboreum]|uniref:Uncharacterized protein n=1 Tax=Gossypium arboreum TaxID=29729 RepID=A0ABR0N5K7_GOSAR|nr:hypothetical protein PVK06_040487 [Gossypium arboreum]
MAEVEIKEINNKIIELFEPNKFTTEIQPKLLHLKDLSIPKDWMIDRISGASTSKPEEEDNISTNSTTAIGLMDRGKKRLEQVGEWTTVHKKPNKGKSITPNQGFIKPSLQPSFYSNQGYYIPYPMVKAPVGSQLFSTPSTTDGRRIVADDTGNIQKNRDEESLKLLKKIADMEIDDYPSHIINEI